MTNKPYVRGNLRNPINENIINQFPNRRERRQTMKKLKNNK